MTSGGTLVNFATPPAPLCPHPAHHQIGFEGGGPAPPGHPQQHPTRRPQLNMLDVKMSGSPSSSSSPCSSSAPSLSPVTPVNIITDCYGMWESDMSHLPPTKLETTDIMDLIEPSSMSGGRTQSPSLSPSRSTRDPGGASPTTTIHHTPSAPALSQTVSQACSSPQSVTSPSSSTSSTSSSSQYLVPLPSLGDPYGNSADSAACHLFDQFHSGMDKLSDTSHGLQEGGYDTLFSEMSQPPPPPLSQHSHHTHSSSQGHLHPPHHVPSLHDSGVLLLDMSQPHPPSNLHHHHPLQDGGGGQCSPGCPCLSNSAYSPTSSLMGGGGGGPTGDPFSSQFQHLHHHSHHHPHEIQRQHSDYSSSWEDLHGGQHAPTHDLVGDYPMLFRKESPSTSESVMSYPDNDSESKSSSLGMSEMGHHHPHISPPPAKRKVGRPPKKDKKLKRNEKKTGRLWEFIRDLLKNPDYCPSLVKWENHEEGHFRFVNSEKVAQLWGQIKGNPRMTYEKLSRAMRYYYKSHVFEPVLGRRLVYKFGYNATNWKPINPNFASSSSSPPSSSHSNHAHHLAHHHHHAHQYHPQHHHKMYN